MIGCQGRAAHAARTVQCACAAAARNRTSAACEPGRASAAGARALLRPRRARRAHHVRHQRLDRVPEEQSAARIELNNETAVKAWVPICPSRQDLMMLQHFNLPPDIGGPLSRPAELKAMLVARRQAAGGGLIDCQVQTYDGVQCLQRIEKNQQRVGPESNAVQGMTYSGSLIVPRRDFSYVVMIHCREDGTTGVRESTLLVTCGHEERMRHVRRMITKTGPGPMDEGFEWDKEQYDAQFPGHPLSRVRRQLRALNASLRVSAAVRAAPPFTGDPPP